MHHDPVELNTIIIRYSIWVLVDANYTFLYEDVGCPGRISDGGVFKNTQLYRKLENRQLLYHNLRTP
ncbi:hypothetical protein PR048_022983 [Dryococelus australis]|uniref:Uncharacterized protein n=1 Tax=Dryococelus australis TaxID=614101 RepID=A0ABQ9GSV1_9NEOP|nr:hypothetical protein PR048_022983 [Dryococelus australis]